MTVQRTRQNIDMYQGDAALYSFTFYVDPGLTIPWDFSTATEVKMSVKQSLDSASELFDVTATDGVDGNDWANGIAVFSVSAAQSVLLERDGKFDAQVTLGGAPTTPVYGDVLVTRQVTA
jgi:hypothetical protein